MSHYEVNKSGFDSTRHANQYVFCYLPLSQFTIVTLYNSNNWTLNNSTRKIEITCTKTLARVVSQSTRNKAHQLPAHVIRRTGAICVDPHVTEKVHALHIK